MRILFTCHRLPYPPKRGGKIRPFNIIKHFHDQGHEVTVASLARSAAEESEGQGLRAYCHKLHVGQIGKIAATAQMLARLPTMQPSSMGYFYSASLHRHVAAEIDAQKYDFAFVHCSSAAQYVRKLRNVPTIMDFGDMDSQKWLNYSQFKPRPFAYGFWLEGRKLAREEKRLAAQFDTSTCTTAAEHAILKNLGVAPRTDWFPNGVDAEFFSPGEQAYDDDQICFIGRMDYFPNQQGMLRFCRDVLPQIRERRPTTKLMIVGANPSADIRALAELPGVTVTGTVDDVRPYVRASALSVAPLSIAHGTQNKILESMAMGVPVVASKIASGGVDAIPEEHILVAESAGEFASQTLRLLEQRPERMRLSSSGRSRVLERHNWASSLQRLDRIVEKTLGSRRS